MIARVLKALSGVAEVYVATVRGHPVEEWCRSVGVNVLLTSGRGYVEDLAEALSAVGTPAMVAPADMPLLTRQAVRRFLEAAYSLGVDVVTLEGPRGPVGLSLFKKFRGGPLTWCSLYTSESWTLNVNNPEDLEAANELCDEVVDGCG
jgi:adenosylcobinamide-phosphate guanylyltransferase